MRLKVQITVESGEGESEMVEVACLERTNLRPDTLGLSLARRGPSWPGWSKRSPSAKWPSLSPNSSAVPGAAGSARAKVTIESCFVPRLAN